MFKNLFKTNTIDLPLVAKFSDSLLESMIDGSFSTQLYSHGFGSNYVFKNNSTELYLSGSLSNDSLKSRLGGDLSKYNSVILIDKSISDFYLEQASLEKNLSREKPSKNYFESDSIDFIQKNSFNKTYLLFSDGLIIK